MGLYVSLIATRQVEVYESNITHNLAKMADAAGIYKHLWHPEELGILSAFDLIAPLEEVLARLKANPDYFRKYNSSNGWGMYEHFVLFVERYLNACKENTDACVTTNR